MPINDTGRQLAGRAGVNSCAKFTGSRPSLLLTFSKVSWRLLEMFPSSGSQPLQTELCGKSYFITQGYHADLPRSES
jgi:hypothetical protein